MANFFKGLAKTVGNAMELASLDNINSSILENYDKSFENYTSNLPSSLPNESEAAALEEKWINDANNDYDRRASEATGRSVPDNWQDGAEDKTAVRKRMLNRELAKRRGNLTKFFKNFRVLSANKMKEIEAATTAMLLSLSNLALPTTTDAIKRVVGDKRTEVRANIQSVYPGGLPKYEIDSIAANGSSAWNQIQARFTTVQEELLRKNEQEVLAAKTAIMKRLINDIAQELKATAKTLVQDKTIALTTDRNVYATDGTLLATATTAGCGDITPDALSFLTAEEKIAFVNQIKTIVGQLVRVPEAYYNK